MALVCCGECGREISDKAPSCVGCGAPQSAVIQPQVVAHQRVAFDAAQGAFVGGLPQVVKLAMRAVQDLGWKIDQVNESLGLVTFQTGISWGSWSGVQCSLNVEEFSPRLCRVAGTGKQNLAGAQLLALNTWGEAQGEVQKAIRRMQYIATAEARPLVEQGPAVAKCNVCAIPLTEFQATVFKRKVYCQMHFDEAIS